MTAVCPSCGAPQPFGLLCHRETLRLEQELGAAPELIDDLAIAISKQARLNTGGRGSKGSAHERWAIDPDSSSVNYDYCAVLTYWANMLGADRQIAALAAVQYLLDHINEIRRYDRVPELATQLGTESERAREQVLGPRERTRIPVGPCPELNPDGSHCDGDVIAYIPRQDNAPGRMQCKNNVDHKWTSIQWYRAGKRIHDRMQQIKCEGAA